MSFNVNFKQPPQPKVKMNDGKNKASQIGIGGNALSQNEPNTNDLQFGNTARDILLEKQIQDIKQDVTKEIDLIHSDVNEATYKANEAIEKANRIDREVTQLEQDFNALETRVENDIEGEKNARIEAINEVRNDFTEADTQLKSDVETEIAEEYVKKETKVGGKDLTESTETLDDYKMLEDIGFKSLPNWQTFEEVIDFDDNPLVVAPIYGDPSILNEIIGNSSSGGGRSLSKSKSLKDELRESLDKVLNSTNKKTTKSRAVTDDFNTRTFKVKMVDVLDAETIESHQENDTIANDANEVWVGYYRVTYEGTSYLCLNYYLSGDYSDNWCDLYYHPSFNKWIGWWAGGNEDYDNDPIEYTGEQLTLTFSEDPQPPEEIVDEETLLKILQIDNRLLLCLGVKPTEDNEDTEINEEDIKLFLLIYIENLKRDEESINGDIYFNIFGNSDNIFEILKEILPIGIDLPISMPTNVWLHLGIDNIEGTVEDITQLLDKIKIGVEKPKAFNVDESLINIDYATLFDASYNREETTVTLDNKLDAIYNESTVVNKFIPALPRIISLLSQGLSNLVGIAHLTYTVNTDDWYQSNNVDGYPYEATIYDNDIFEYCEKVDVIFGINECTSGNYAPINYLDNENYCVSIFAKQIPDNDIEINIDAFVKPTLMSNK